MFEEIYSGLRDGIGSPGDSTRVLTKEYVRLKHLNYTSDEICKNLLTLRFEMYKQMGMTIPTHLPKRVFDIADGYFPFIIFADVFVVNHNNVIDNLDAIIGVLTIVLNVIVDEYNNIVSETDQVEDQALLINKVTQFLKDETGIDLNEDI